MKLNELRTKMNELCDKAEAENAPFGSPADLAAFAAWEAAVNARFAEAARRRGYVLEWSEETGWVKREVV